MLKNQINKSETDSGIQRTHRRLTEGDWVQKVQGLRSMYWWLQNSHGDVKYSVRNVVNSVLILCMGQVGAGNIGGGTAERISLLSARNELYPTSTPFSLPCSPRGNTAKIKKNI